MEIEAWTGLGGSWRRLGSHLGSQGRLALKKRARWPKHDRVWASILGSIFDIVRDCSMLFCILFLVSILMLPRPICHGFWSLFWIIFRSFFHKFPDCRQIRKMSVWYSIYYVLSTSAFWKINEKSKMLGTFPDIFPRWLPTSFFIDFGSILIPFWDTCLC